VVGKRRTWVIWIPVLAGILALVLLKQNQVPPRQEPAREKPQPARVIGVPRLDVTPIAIGHGSVRPNRSWEAVAQVRGRILEKHPQLQKGAIIGKNTLLLRIDPTDYELSIAQTEADIQAIRAQLEELQIREANTRASLQIEQSALSLNQKELERKNSLVGKGSISRSDLESQQRSLLAQQQSVQAQRNTLNLIPSQTALLQAQLARDQTRLEAARRDLSRTEIRLPFTGRVAEVHVERDQYVREGESLSLIDDLQLAEVEVQIPIQQMAGLVRSNQERDILTLHGAGDLGLDIEARILLREGDLSATWEARFARLSDTLDPKTRTVGVIVEVDKPYSRVQPGVRPPLLKGLFVEVALHGTPRPDRLVIPREALRGDKVYLAGKDDRLQIREVKVELLQPMFAVIESGLQAGDRVVVSDLIPAIDGMLLEPRHDDTRLQRLKRQVGAPENSQ
jgi:RND family efflux transporter MFP subunit